MADLGFLKKAEIFKGIDDERLNLILKECLEKEYKKGDRIFGEGEKALHIGIVMDGRVDIRFDLPGQETSRENTVSSISEGKAFGWSAFVPPFKYRLSAYCATETCKLMQIDKKQMVNLCDEDTQLGYLFMSNLAGVISTRFHDLQESSEQ